MEKESLPKLETAGFTSVGGKSIGKSPRMASWKTKAVSAVKRINGPTDASNTKAEKGAPQVVDAAYKRLLVKTGICAGIAIVILIISSINTPTANNISEVIEQTVNHEFDIDEDIGRLKFVQSLDEGLESVFSPTSYTGAVYPADGDVVTAFGDSGAKGVRIAPVETEISSIAKGTVTAVGKIDSMGYVEVALDTGETAVYYNVSPLVQVDDIIYAGQALGNLEGDYLYLELKDGEDYIDPLAYVEQHIVQVIQ